MGNREKAIKFELTIITVTIAIVLIILFTFNDVTVAEQNQAVSIDTASKSIIFDLKMGQHVSGSLNYTGETWFAIYDPSGKDITTAEYNYGNHTGSFAFTATVDGKYWLYIDKDYFGTDYIDYQYTVSPAILGLDKTELIIIVIVVGSLLAMATAIKSHRTPNKQIS